MHALNTKGRFIFYTKLTEALMSSEIDRLKIENATIEHQPAVLDSNILCVCILSSLYARHVCMHYIIFHDLMFFNILKTPTQNATA